MDDRTRKLGLAGTGVALFAGFVALTNWTGDDPDSVASLDDQEQGDLAQFCAVFSGGFVPYDLVLRVAAGEAVSPEETAGVGILDSTAAQQLAQSQIDLLADRVPEEYGADARHAAEGLERALDGDLDPDEVDEYAASFQQLEAAASEDCDAVEDIQIGPSGDDGGLFDDGEGDGGGFGEDDGGFGGDRDEGGFREVGPDGPVVPTSVAAP
jgi:hypothetical protein